MDTGRSASSPRDLAPHGPRPYYSASARPTGANAIELNSDEELRRIDFLHHVGDYAGRLHNCLKKAAEAVHSHLPRRVADLDNDLRIRPGYQRYREALEDSIRYLQQQGFDVDLQMVSVAVEAYAERNELCHAEVGNPSLAGDLGRFEQVIEGDKAALPRILPESRVHQHETWARLMVFYKQSQPWMKPSTRDKSKADSEANHDPFPGRTQMPAILDTLAEHQLQTASRPIPQERNPRTRQPIGLTGRTRTRPCVSDPLPYYSQKRKASSSPDPEGSHHGGAVDNQRRGYLVLSSSWASQEHRVALRGIHDELEAFCSEDPGKTLRKMQECKRLLVDARRQKGKASEAQQTKENQKANKRARRAQSKEAQQSLG